MKFEFLQLSETDSTNNYIKKIKQDATEYIVIAERQTGGKGRLGRTFVSNEGGLYLSISYTPAKHITPEQTLHYTAIAALAVKRVLTKLTDKQGLTFDIKWPNDIYLNGKKVCGILTEAVHTGVGFYIIFGIGVNLTNNISRDISYASSILELTGISLDRVEVAELISGELIALLSENATDFAPYLSEYKASCITIGKRVKTATVSGIVKDIDNKAGLIVETEDGKNETVIFGEAVEF